MIADAFRAELAKALRNRNALFWGFMFAPLLTLAFAIMQALWSKGAAPTPLIPVNPYVMSVFRALDAPNNPLYGIFWIVGAAGLFAGEYRWSTLRYMLVRNSRVNVLASKFAVFLLFAAGSMLILLLSAVLSVALRKQAGIAAPVTGGAFGGLLALYAIGLVRLLGIAAVAALSATATRSMVGSIVITLVYLIAEFFAELRVQMAGPAWLGPALPNVAFKGVEAWTVQALGGPAAETGLASPLICLSAWAIGLGLITIGLFLRQDLSRE